MNPDLSSNRNVPPCSPQNELSVAFSTQLPGREFRQRLQQTQAETRTNELLRESARSQDSDYNEQHYVMQQVRMDWGETRAQLKWFGQVLKTVKTWFKRCFCVCNLAFNNRNKVSEDCIQRECWDGEKIHSIQWYVLDLSFWKCCRTKVYCSRKMSVSFLILKSHRLWCKHITSNSAYIMRLWQFSLCGAISTHFGYTWGNVSMSVVS